MVRYFFFGGFLVFLTIFLGGFFPFSDVDFVDEVELDQADETGRGVPNPLISSIMTKMIKSSLYIASQRGVRGGEGWSEKDGVGGWGWRWRGRGGGGGGGLLHITVYVVPMHSITITLIIIIVRAYFPHA